MCHIQIRRNVLNFGILTLNVFLYHLSIADISRTKKCIPDMIRMKKSHFCHVMRIIGIRRILEDKQNLLNMLTWSVCKHNPIDPTSFVNYAAKMNDVNLNGAIIKKSWAEIERRSERERRWKQSYHQLSMVFDKHDQHKHKNLHKQLIFLVIFFGMVDHAVMFMLKMKETRLNYRNKK